MKIIFLDCDGVLNCQNSWPHKLKTNTPLDPDKIALLNDVVTKTGCRIVMSSTWRTMENCRDVLRAAGVLNRFHKDWRTYLPYAIYTSKTLGVYQERGWEISKWLGEHPETKAYAIVDDNTGMLPDQIKFFVQTTWEKGLQPEHRDALIEILGLFQPQNAEINHVV